MEMKSVMTACPYTIDAEEVLEKALEKMKLYNIRHLPVIKGDDLVGVVSQRDLDLGTLLCKSIGCNTKVEDVCRSDPLIVSESDKLSEITKLMADNKLEYALVINEEDKFSGIFTTTDACRILYMLFEEADQKEE